MRAGVAAWLLALLGWTALLSFYDLDGGAGFEPTDCWVAQTAREMRHAGDWLTPRFSGEVRMQKSPGPYWAVMLTSIVRGTEVDEVSARIPNAIAAIVLVMTVFWLTLHVAGQRAAIFAGFATASSALILLWSHRAASDLGLAALCTLSLAALWIGSEIESPGPKRVALWMLGYFAAGLGMLYKMPMPLAAVGLPVLAYLLVRNRWRILASPWHLLGLLLFLLPWLPWALAVVHSQGMALAKWRVEFLDRYTGDLPNVEGQDSWAYLLFYLVPVAVYCLPFSLSIPAAVGRAFRRQPGVRRDGTLFMALWFFSLLVFFTASTGKELRYFLPALPPIFVLLGIELAALFDPQRQRSEVLVRLAAAAVLILLPVALIAGYRPASLVGAARAARTGGTISMARRTVGVSGHGVDHGLGLRHGGLALSAAARKCGLRDDRRDHVADVAVGLAAVHAQADVATSLPGLRRRAARARAARAACGHV